MKANLLAALSLAPLIVLAVPFVVVESLPAAPQHHRHQPPPAPVATVRPAHALPEVILDVEDAGVQIEFDNRPVTPSTNSKPDQILDLPRPVATAYLWSLGKKPAELPKEAWAAVEASTITQMEIGFVNAHHRHGRPGALNCYYARLNKDHNERLVVFLVLSFLAIVILVETGGVIFGSLRQAVSVQGAIRLGEADEAQRQPLSVRAEDEDVEAAQHADEVTDDRKAQNEKTPMI